MLAVIAIGSSVRPNVESNDLDLIAVYECQPPDLGHPPVDIDIRTFLRGNLEALMDEGQDLLGWAVRYGAPLIDKRRLWQIFAGKFADTKKLPSLEVMVRRLERTDRVLRTLIDIGDEDAAGEQMISLLTHLARAALTSKGVYPASRPELADQLRGVGEPEIASLLEDAMQGKQSPIQIYAKVSPMLRNSMLVGATEV